MKHEIQQTFLVGDNWLYYKIYTGEKTSDTILKEIILPITEELLLQNIVQKWFFIRYEDPDHHIRLRLFCADKTNIGKVINVFQPYFTDYFNHGLIWKLHTDNYKRELERYGHNTMALSETLFFEESKIIVNFLNIIEGSESEELRWLFGLKILDNLLDVFDFNINDKYHFIEMLKTSFGEEFGMNRFLKKQLDDKYRDKKNIIISFIESQSTISEDYLNPIYGLLDQYNQNISPLAKQLITYNNSKKLEVNFNNLLASYIHMTMNRLFKSKNRLNELVIYNFLFRYYKAEIGKSKNYINKESLLVKSNL